MKPNPMLVVSFVATLLFVPACGKKAPKTAADTAPAPVAAAPAPTAMAPAPTPAQEQDIWSADLETLNAYVRERGLLGDVYFDFDRSELRADTRDRLAKNADFLRSRPELVVTVEGHCDERDTAEYNLALGDARSSSIRGYLESLGVASGQLLGISYGEERPVCTESTESCWWRNRRGHFVISGRLRAS